MYKHAMHTLYLLIFCFITFNSGAQSSLQQDKLNTTKTFPEELATVWELDEAASLEYAKKSAYWDENIAKLMPKLIATTKPIKYRFVDGKLISLQGQHEQQIDIRLQQQTQSTYMFEFQVNDKNGALKVMKAAGGRINIQADGLLGYQFLLWNKRRDRLSGV